MLALRGLEYERVTLSVIDRSDRDEVIGRDANPALRVPTLRLEDGRHLAESNAIIWYLTEQGGLG
ncbi:MAG: glutathione S-transferase N-terminal domain-containing protein [Thermoleophilia bacterium]